MVLRRIIPCEIGVVRLRCVPGAVEFRRLLEPWLSQRGPYTDACESAVGGGHGKRLLRYQGTWRTSGPAGPLSGSAGNPSRPCVERGRVSQVAIVETEEIRAMLEAVTENMLPQIVEQQTTNGIDTVTGATNTSQAVIQAAGTAINDAGGGS
ncbi:MAG: FMN-binding protein [Spirochaetales bacterium]